MFEPKRKISPMPPAPLPLPPARAKEVERQLRK